MSELFENLDRLRNAEGKVAVATLVNTRGTTPRKEGAKMLVGEDGRVRGRARLSISGRARHYRDAGPAARGQVHDPDRRWHAHLRRSLRAPLDHAHRGRGSCLDAADVARPHRRLQDHRDRWAASL